MKEWKVYSSKHNGRKKFQTHLGIALINKGIEMDWKAPYNAEDKPAWMPKTIKNGKYHPCDCGICFFCKNGKTSTIAHGKVTSQPRVKKCSGKYDYVKRNYCVVCMEEAKEKYPDSPVKDLRKASILKQSLKGCKMCRVAVCKEHWKTFSHTRYEGNKGS